MSYPIDLDQYGDESLAAEIRRRAKCRDRGVCPYCHAPLTAPTCRFPSLHRGKDEAMVLGLEVLGLEHAEAVKVAATMLPTPTRSVLTEVAAERARQDQQWGQQDHPDMPEAPTSLEWGRVVDGLELAARLELGIAPSWGPIAAEELGEALNAPTAADLRAELVQVAAVLVAWIEAIDRRRGGGE